MKKNRQNRTMDIAPDVIEESVAPKVDDAVLLKVAHTHAGVRYEANTPLSDIADLTNSAQDYMKTNNII